MTAARIADIAQASYIAVEATERLMIAPSSSALRAGEKIMSDKFLPLAMQRAGAESITQIAVTSPAIHGSIARVQSEYGDGVSPEIWWDRVDGARTYALILEDPDAKSTTPFVHWVAYNIPADLTSLPEGLQEVAELIEPKGMLQGKTSRGSMGYFGPRPPVGDPPHHYHFQLFALDSELGLPPGAECDDVLNAMKGHVLAAGELVGTYQQLVESPK